MQGRLVRKRLHKMHQKYLECNNPNPVANLSEEDAEKMLLLKKKLASLEKERCMRLCHHKDVTAIEQKIAQQKATFSNYCQKQR